MKPEPDEKVFDWILHGRDTMPKKGAANWRGNFLSQLVPPVFEAYAKILHRIDAKYKGLDHPLSSTEIELLKIPSCEPLRSFVEKRRNDPVGSRIRWKELAELLNIEFAPEICHEWYRTKLEDPWCWPHLLEGQATDGLAKMSVKPSQRRSIVPPVQNHVFFASPKFRSSRRRRSLSFSGEVCTRSMTS